MPSARSTWQARCFRGSRSRPGCVEWLRKGRKHLTHMPRFGVLGNHRRSAATVGASPGGATARLLLGDVARPEPEFAAVETFDAAAVAKNNRIAFARRGRRKGVAVGGDAAKRIDFARGGVGHLLAGRPRHPTPAIDERFAAAPPALAQHRPLATEPSRVRATVGRDAAFAGRPFAAAERAPLHIPAAAFEAAKAGGRARRRGILDAAVAVEGRAQLAA